MIYVNRFITLVAFALLSLGSFQAFAASDMDITSAVKTAIAADKTTADSKIDVSTKEGTVNLSGNVQTEGEASAAIQAANSVAGVKDVDTDKLMVQNSTQPYKDSYITAKVKGSFVREKLFGDKPIDVTSISVETKDGVVYLTGTAQTPGQVKTAIKLAKAIKGVKSVESKLEVKA